MADQRDGGISWTDETWNPVRGCSRVSEGCRNCYAETVAGRFSGPGLAYEGLATMTPSGARWTGEVRLIEKHLEDPLRWKRPRRIFVNSMSDLFHEKLSDRDIDRVFAVMALAPQHTFQILTKRAERMAAYLTGSPVLRLNDLAPYWPLPNVWLGVSAEDQETFEKRWAWLRKTPAAVRWISFEPLLGPIDMQSEMWEDLGTFVWPDWAVIGGESGQGARPFDIQWAVSLLDQCEELGVKKFMKQLGARPIDSGYQAGIFAPEDRRSLAAAAALGQDHVGFNLLVLKDQKGGDMAEWPEALRVREMADAL